MRSERSSTDDSALVRDDTDVGVVSSPRAKHRRAADIDLLDQLVEVIRVARRGGERIEIDHDSSTGRIAAPATGVDARQDDDRQGSAMDPGEGLDRPSASRGSRSRQRRRSPGDRLAQHARVPPVDTSSNRSDEGLGEFDETTLVRDDSSAPRDGHDPIGRSRSVITWRPPRMSTAPPATGATPRVAAADASRPGSAYAAFGIVIRQDCDA